MSAIGQAKDQIATASGLADEAVTALSSAGMTIEDAVATLYRAAGNSAHQRVSAAATAYSTAAAEAAKAIAHLRRAQKAANEYASQLG